MTRTQTVHVRLTDDEYNRLKTVCDAEGVTISTMLRQRVQESFIPTNNGDWD